MKEERIRSEKSCLSIENSIDKRDIGEKFSWNRSGNLENWISM